MDIEIIKKEVKKIVSKLGRREVLAVGLFGSVMRGDFNQKSDVDIFIITEYELKLEDQDELYYLFSELIPRLERDVTVLVYDLKSLKKVPSWQTLNLIKDAYFIYDKSGIKKIFENILKEAEKYGIIYDNEEKIFKLKKLGRAIFSLKDAGE